MVDLKEKEVKIFTGNANPALAQDIADYLSIPLSKMLVGRFPDGEIRVRALENVRGSDVFVVQPTYAPADNLMELLIMIDALRRASAHTICAVIPFFGYARQDRKTRSREPISAKLVANLITVAGANRVIALDLHAGQIQGFFDIPTDNLTAMLILAGYFKNKHFEAPPVIVAPDVGSVHRATEFAKEIPHSTQAIFVKRRLSPDEVETNRLIGDVEGKTVILVDDAIHTGGTMVSAAKEVIRRGAKEVYACATHGIFAGNSLEKIENSPIKELVITDTIPHENLPDNVKVLSVASLIGEAIKRISLHQSISALFERKEEK
jgi:ribose-phosphate pyrophosphokinase